MSRFSIFYMAAPITENSFWYTNPETKEDFELNAMAPIMRQQNIVHLVNVITGWYKKRPAFL